MHSVADLWPDRSDMPNFITKPLTPSTWADFETLAEAHHGVWGGCWCSCFHLGWAKEGRSVAGNRADKEHRVRTGRAHAALVYDGAVCVGWCQFGAPAELPFIKHAKAYATGFAGLPDWRITCFFVGRGHRGLGVAAAALAGALDLIGGLGGGIVESYPEDTIGRKVSGSFLHNGTLAMFQAAGFEPDRKIGKDRWVVRREVGKGT